MVSKTPWIFALFCLIVPSIRSKVLPSAAEISPEYDFVIVGGGTAGNVIANRLTEDPQTRILVIEAGGSNEGVIESEVPFFASSFFDGSGYDWNFTTTPQAGLGGRSIPFPRGYILGGSSSINGLAYTRGSSEDYDLIAQLTGDEGWSWNQLQSYIRKNEHWSRPADNHSTIGQFDPSAHGFHGILSVSLPGFPQAIDDRVAQATQGNGEFQYNIDMNSGNPLGFGWTQTTITSEGRRDSSATSYLNAKIINRPNLDVLLNNQVTRLVSTNSSSSSNGTLKFNTVEFSQIVDGVVGTNKTVVARQEVILSAGSIGTPHILLHSGIGDREALSAVGITPVHHLPDVGQNLTDHPLTLNAWFVNSTDTFDELNRNATLLAKTLEQWNRTGTGPLTDGGSNHLGWLRLPNNSSIFETINDPAAGPHTAHIELLIANGILINPLPSTGNFISVGTCLVTPVSRGSLIINSSDPLVHPQIDPAFLKHEFDRFTLREALRAANRFLGSPAWHGYVLQPFGDLASIDLNDDEQVDEYLRANTGSTFHPVGTAAMSPRGASWGVTDPDLKVKGIEGVRVVDASIFAECIFSPKMSWYSFPHVHSLIFLLHIHRHLCT